MQDWEKGSGYVKEPKVTVGPGISKDGSATGGVEIEATNGKYYVLGTNNPQEIISLIR